MRPLRRTATEKTKPVDVGKIGKLMRMLGSDKGGEVVAAVAALRRVLEAADMDFHSLADAVADGLKPRKSARGTSWEPPDPDLLNWESMSWYALYWRRYLTDDDTRFVRQALLGRVGFNLGRATPELMRRLRSIVEEVKAARADRDWW